MIYVDWRLASAKKMKKKILSKNTALTDLKVLAVIMQQALRLEKIQTNPIHKLGIPSQEISEKAELSDEEISKCLTALENEPAWLKQTFLIGLHTGCRINETTLDMKLVDFDRNTITFGNPKGGRKKSFTRPLPKALLPVLLPLKGRAVSHELSKNPSSTFRRFFDRIKLPHLCFHCLRVTYVTRLARAGVPQPIAMRLVNHSSRNVHAIYQRLGVEDVRQYADSVSFP